MTLSPIDLALIDRWQRGFPLVERPFAVVGGSVGLDERNAIGTFGRLLREQVISRIGAVVRPHTVGASTLAAMQVPAEQFDRVAAAVSAEPLVNHNYERTHRLNLWFVVAGPTAESVSGTIRRIEARTGFAVVDLPLVKAYHLDLGFPLNGARPPRRPCSRDSAPAYAPGERDRALLAAIEDGLPLVSQPYEAIGRMIGAGEGEVIGRLETLSEAGVVTRFGCIVRHRRLGYTANAMAVWDLPDQTVDRTARLFVGHPQVTLCYRRPRRPPLWPYNLFCMVHAKTRDGALAVIDDLNLMADTGLNAQAVLFSTRCYKQRGAVFSGGGLN